MNLFQRPFYPFLLALYPVLFMVRAYEDLPVRATDTFLLLLLVLIAPTTGWAVARLCDTNKWTRGALAFVAVLALYGAVPTYAAIHEKVGAVPATGASLALWAVPTVTLIILGRRKKDKPDRGTHALNIFAVILLLFPVWGFVHQWISQPEVEQGDQEVAPTQRAGDMAAPNNSLRPDIYLIILDKYSSLAEIQRNYDYDPAPFGDTLRSLGFQLPQRQRSNYIHTDLALAALFNWKLFATSSDPTAEIEAARQLVRSNPTIPLLRELGYRPLFLPTTYATTRRMEGTEIPAEFRNPVGIRGVSANDLILRLTPLRPLWEALCNTLDCTSTEGPRYPYPVESAADLMAKLSWLETASIAYQDPIFVIAHLLVPHEPYLFGPECQARRLPLWPSSDQKDAESVKKAYANQVKCINELIATTVTRLVGLSQDHPLILIQSDHGHGRIGLAPGRIQTLAEAGPEKVNERLSTFAAYYFPPLLRSCESSIYEGMTPVNLLPVVFNNCLGTSLPLSEDRTFWSQFRAPFRFTEIR